MERLSRYRGKSLRACHRSDVGRLRIGGRVADVLLDRSPVAPDRRTHRVEVARLDVAERFGVQTLAERRRAGDVAEHDGDGLSDVRHPGGRCERCRTGGTEREIVRTLPTAAGTGQHLQERKAAHPRALPVISIHVHPKNRLPEHGSPGAGGLGRDGATVSRAWRRPGPRAPEARRRGRTPQRQPSARPAAHPTRAVPPDPTPSTKSARSGTGRRSRRERSMNGGAATAGGA